MLELYLISTVAFIGLLYYMSENAPEGYEDEDGFHYGKEKIDTEK